MMKFSLVSILYLASLVTLSSAFFGSVKNRSPDEYVEALLGRWSRPPRKVKDDEQVPKWFFKRLLERKLRKYENIVAIVQQMMNSSTLLEGREFRQPWYVQSEQNREGLHRLLVEIDNLMFDSNPKHCGMKWMEETFGALDYLFDLSSRLRKAKVQKRLPFLNEDDKPNTGSELYLFLIRYVKVNIVFCLRNITPLYLEYLNGERNAERVLDDRLLPDTKGLCSYCLPKKDLSLEEETQELIKLAKSKDTLNDDNFPALVLNTCQELVTNVDSFISTYNLATIFMPDELNAPLREGLYDEPTFKKLNEYNRLCCRYLTLKSPLSTFEVNGERRYNGSPDEIDLILVDNVYVAHKEKEISEQTRRDRDKQSSFYSRHKPEVIRKDLPRYKPEKWYEQELSIAQQIALGFRQPNSQEEEELAKRIGKMPVGQVE